MDDKKKKYLIIGLVVIVILFLLFKKDDKTGESAYNVVSQNATRSLPTINVSTKVEMDAETEAHQVLLTRLANLNGGILPNGATSASDKVLKEMISNLEQLQKAYAEYAKLEDDDKQMSDEDLVANGYTNLSSVNALIEEVKKRQKKEAWDQRRKYIEELVRAFYDNMTNVGTWLGDCKGYATETFKSLIELQKSEKIYANQYFGTLGGVPVGYSWNKITKHATIAYTISDAMPESGESVDRDRAQHSQISKSEAMKISAELKQAYSGIAGSVNQYGEIVSLWS